MWGRGEHVLIGLSHLPCSIVVAIIQRLAGNFRMPLGFLVIDLWRALGDGMGSLEREMMTTSTMTHASVHTVHTAPGTPFMFLSSRFLAGLFYWLFVVGFGDSVSLSLFELTLY